MANSLACHAGDIVLLRAEIIGIGSEGPYVRVEIGSGGANHPRSPAVGAVAF